MAHVESDGQKPEAGRAMADSITCLAPGEYILLPDAEVGDDEYTVAFGLSYCGSTMTAVNV